MKSSFILFAELPVLS